MATARREPAPRRACGVPTGVDVRRLYELREALIPHWLFDVAGRRTPLPAQFHAQFAAALVSGDPIRADAAMRAHVRHGLAAVSGGMSALAASE